MVDNRLSSIVPVSKLFEVLERWVIWRSNAVITISAELRTYAVRSEMAVKLADVVLRRTDLGAAGAPTPSNLRLCATTMAHEMKWEPSRMEREMDEVRSLFPLQDAASSKREDKVGTLEALDKA